MTAPWTVYPEKRIKVYERDNYTCGYCLAGNNLTVDHIKPISKGGTHGLYNLITCCYSCNNKKGDMHWKTFAGIIADKINRSKSSIINHINAQRKKAIEEWIQ